MQKSAPNSADDAVFDSVYPLAIQLVSRRFWTPVAVARRAALLFQEAGARRVLDVGSGVGKFVLAAAEVAPEVEFVGVEQRPHLVRIARDACAKLRRPNVNFRAGDVTAVSWQEFDGFYLYNSLAENFFAEEDRLDDRVVLTQARFVHDALCVERALRNAKLGAVVVTYHGASVRMPDSYELSHCEHAGTNWLRRWTKRRLSADGAYFIEEGDGVSWHSGAPDLQRHGA